MATVESIARKYGLSAEETKRALDTLGSGEQVILAISGRMFAGKDTTAPLVLEHMGFKNPQHEFFADDLKKEMTEVIHKIAASPTISEAAVLISSTMDAPLPKVQHVVATMWDEVQSGVTKDGYSRTVTGRLGIQYWATELRRGQNPDYWAIGAIRRALLAINSGRSVFMTDSRFENEIDALGEVGAKRVRLKISDAEQDRRSMLRDGIRIAPEARLHISETALFDYEAAGNFDFILDTDGMALDEVVATVSKAIS